MALTNDQLGKALVSSGLMPVAEVKAIWAALPAEERPKDAQAFADLLIAQGKLTKFQATELLSGTNTPLILGDYQLLAKIGAGGMGQVFKAQHRHMKRTVAIKLLPAELTKDEAAIKRFQREVEAAAKLSHPNIVQAHDASLQRGVWYLVMEYVEGRDLAGIVAAEGSLPIARAVNYIRQSARGLGFAHENGVVHRDIKPANLLLDKKGTIKILDMGLARFDDGAAQEGLTQSGQVMGTVDYMAPEQAFDTRHADARADVYSLGCTLFRLLTAQNMYEGESLVQKLMGHQSKPIPKLSKARPDVPPKLEAVFERMVAKDPKERYQTMAEVLTALAPFEEGGKADDGGGLTAHFEGIGGGSATNAALLAQPTAAQLSVGEVLPTISLNNPLQATDPVSAASIQIARSLTPQPGAIKRPPANRKKLLIAAGGAAAALIVLLGIWGIIKDKDGKETARVLVPEGGTATVQGDNTSVPKTQNTSSTTTPVNYALELTGSNWAVLPIEYDGKQPFTLEAYAIPEPTNEPREMFLLSFSGTPGAGLTIIGNTWQARISRTNRGFFRTRGKVVQPGKAVHIAWVWDGSKLMLFLDGEPFTEYPRGELQKELDVANIGPLLLGKNNHPNAAGFFTGKVYELRVSKTARYANTFAPAKRFETDADTLALYHFDEGTGDVLNDSSGNNHHGKIVGAKWVKTEHSTLAANPAAYDGLATGKWIPLLRTQEEFDKLIAAKAFSQNAATFKDGALRLDHGQAVFTNIVSANGILRARVNKGAGPNIGIWLRMKSEAGSVVGWYAGNRQFSAGWYPQAQKQANYKDLWLNGDAKAVSAEFEWALAVVGNEMKIFVDGQLLRAVRLKPGDEVGLATGSPGFSANSGIGTFRDIEYMSLDTPPTHLDITPKYALDFNYEVGSGTARVEMPQVFDASKPFTVEMYTTLRQPEKLNNRLFFSRQGNRILSMWGRANIEWQGETRPEGKPKLTANAGIAIGKRTHVAAVSSSTQLELFIDGKSVGKVNAPLGNGTYWADLGGLRTLDPQWTQLYGTIDDVRISTTARYSADFTPPAELSPDKDTLLRYDFKEGTGEVLNDSSGNNHHGKIVGAKWVKLDTSLTETAPNYALKFEGVNQFLNAYVPVAADKPWTLEGWATPYRELSEYQPSYIFNGRTVGTFYRSTTHDGLRWQSFVNGMADQNVAYTSDKKIELNKPVHVAQVFDGKSFTLYVNGVPQGKPRTVQQEAGLKLSITPGPSEWSASGSRPGYHGILDEVRFSSVARYKEAFTPAQRFETDRDTIALYHFDEGQGDELKDSSGNNHHGKIIGAKWVRIDAPATPSLASKAALDFSGSTTPGTPRVELPKIIDVAKPLTVEMFVNPRTRDGKNRLLFGAEGQAILRIWGNNVLDWSGPAKQGTENRVLAYDKLPLGKRSHVAAVSTGSELRLYIDGQEMGRNSVVMPEVIKRASIGGQFYEDGTWQPFDGTIDGVRISTTARYDSSFTPPTVLTSDKDTLGLYKFDEGSGDELKDSSGNNHHGKIVGANWVRVDASFPNNISPSVAKTIPADALAFNGHRYLLVDDLSNWNEAKAKAEAMGGHLATVTTKEEMDWLRVNIVSKRAALPEGVYIGGVATNEDWSWITGEPFDRKLWLGFATGVKKDRSVLCWTSNYNWNNELPNSPMRYYLVEWDTLGPETSAAQSHVAPPLAKAPFDAAQAKAHQEAWAKHLGIQVETTNSVGMKMTLIPPGEFLMGSTDEQVATAVQLAEKNDLRTRAVERIQQFERPQHRVVLTKPFQIGTTEVTYGQFKKYMATLPLDASGQGPIPQHEATYLTDDHPVAVATWDDAVGYCRWLSAQEKTTYRLPTDAEWEYACRAGTTTHYSFGDDPEQLKDYARYEFNNGGRLQLVGSRKPNPFGLYDMHGNAWEWCSDYHDPKWYEKSPVFDPQGPAVGANRIFRGGWHSDVATTRSAYRNYGSLDQRKAIGFRVVRELLTIPGLPDKTRTPTTPSVPTSKLWLHDPAFRQWVRDVQAMPAEKQIEAVSQKLVELNPGATGKAKGTFQAANPTIRNNVVTSIQFDSYKVSDISPLRALSGLQELVLYPNDRKPTAIADLSPLEGLPLYAFHCTHSAITDLSPLRKMPLQFVSIVAAPISDLSPLTGMALKNLRCGETNVADLQFLESCPTLEILNIERTKVTAASVAALQKALPKCKIEWDAPKNAASQKPWESPAFQQWITETQKLHAEEQLKAVSKKLVELNPGFDGKFRGWARNLTPKIENGVVTELGFITDQVTDISPVRALAGLQMLSCKASNPDQSKLADLTPLQGMPLKGLSCAHSPTLNDLSPLRGMPLTTLEIDNTMVTDLTPLRGMPLTYLRLIFTPVSSFEPLRGMPLQTILARQTKVTDLTPLADCKDLKSLEVRWTKLPKESILSLQKALPNCKIEWDDPSKPWLMRAFQQWITDTQKLPAEEQLKAVSKKLVELNPGFDGALRGPYNKPDPTIEAGAVTGLGMHMDQLRDVSPVRALDKLKILELSSSDNKRKAFADLAPLAEMHLTALIVAHTQVTDLTPLAEMPLNTLNIGDTPVADLTPLRNSPLSRLFCELTSIKDLRPLLNCKLTLIEGRKNAFDPSSVEAIKQAFPNCIINWDDPAKKSSP